jgi:molecular chaperone GrpE
MIKKGKTHEIPVEGEDPPVPESPPGPEETPADAGGEKKLDATYEQAIDHLQRLQAEFANYRKRVDRERLETVTWAQRVLVEKLLPVLEDLDRAMASVEGDDSPAAQGLTLIHDKLHAVLAEAGLERIAAVGEPFDPGLHEALMTQPVEPDRVGTVLAELVPGFTFRGKLVRPTRVQVGVDGEDSGA